MSTTTTELTQEQKRLKIAEACGWKNFTGDRYVYGLMPNGQDRTTVPDFFNDLNACHEMEKSAPMGYGDEVRAVVARDAGVAPQHICDQYVICATAAQRAEAFGRIMHLWP